MPDSSLSLVLNCFINYIQLQLWEILQLMPHSFVYNSPVCFVAVTYFALSQWVPGKKKKKRIWKKSEKIPEY